MAVAQGWGEYMLMSKSFLLGVMKMSHDDITMVLQLYIYIENCRGVYFAVCCCHPYRVIRDCVLDGEDEMTFQGGTKVFLAQQGSVQT